MTWQPSRIGYGVDGADFCAAIQSGFRVRLCSFVRCGYLL